MNSQEKPVTRTDIAFILASIGKPGEKRSEKFEAIKQFEMKNNQGHGIENTLDSYTEW